MNGLENHPVAGSAKMHHPAEKLYGQMAERRFLVVKEQRWCSGLSPRITTRGIVSQPRGSARL